MPSKDKELSRTGNIARAAFEDGATAKAIDLYRKALNRAHAMDDATEIGNTAYNLALCHTLVGQLDQASASLAEAKAAFERSGSNSRRRAVVGGDHRSTARQPGAGAVAGRPGAVGITGRKTIVFQAALLKGTIACEQNDPANAKTALAEADQHHVTNTPLLAARERLAGNIFLLEGNPAEAAAAFDRAAALFQKAKHYRDMAITLRLAGEAYREAGDTQRAEDRLFRAKRSLAAQGEKAE